VYGGFVLFFWGVGGGINIACVGGFWPWLLSVVGCFFGRLRFHLFGYGVRCEFWRPVWSDVGWGF